MTRTRPTEPPPAGPPTAAAVWERFGAELQRFVHRRIADPHRAADVVGEIMLAIAARLPTVRDDRRIAAWVHRVARNAIIDEYRRAARDPRPAELDDLDRPTAAADAWVEDQADVVRELAACLGPLLDELPEAHRRALELVELQGLPQAEAAAREGISVSGMKSRVQRGRRQLLGLLQRCCELTLDGRGLPLDHRPHQPDACRC